MFLSIEERLVSEWGYWYERLVEFWKTNGHANITSKTCSDIGLVKWAKNQSYYQNNWNQGLESEKVEKLNAIGFKWQGREATWNDFYEKLKKFWLDNGHSHVKISDNKKLHSWMYKQRKAFEENRLSEDKTEKLNEIGFSFASKLGSNRYGVNDSSNWMKNLEEYMTFKKYRDDGLAKIYTKEERKQFSNWSREQRQLYKRGKLKSERIELLNKMGFDWKPQVGINHRHG